MLNSKGKLRIRAYTAGGALPVKGARVQVTGAEESNRNVTFVLTTDSDGITAPIMLPAPDTSFSMEPYPAESPYAIYDLEISADGYLTTVIKGLPVFAGIESFQGINMIPKTNGSNPNGNTDITIPDNNLNF